MNTDIIQSEALKFARRNRKQIARELTDTNRYPPSKLPVSVFMAGSPGAGKTEFSKYLISVFEKQSNRQVVRIDGDEIRDRLPGYDGHNSSLFQGAISLVVEKIQDLVLSQRQSFILDATFSKYEKAADNIRRSLQKGRQLVFIFYLYQHPRTAWEFTQKRELDDGRHVPRESFIEVFLGSKDTVDRVRKEFGAEVVIFLVKGKV